MLAESVDASNEKSNFRDVVEEIAGERTGLLKWL
jgi:hypothetical protein